MRKLKIYTTQQSKNKEWSNQLYTNHRKQSQTRWCDHGVQSPDLRLRSSKSRLRISTMNLKKITYKLIPDLEYHKINNPIDNNPCQSRNLFNQEIKLANCRNNNPISLDVMCSSSAQWLVGWFSNDCLSNRVSMKIKTNLRRFCSSWQNV